MTTDVSAAPGRLAIIQDLANSYDAGRGRDELTTAAVASAWLSSRGLLAPRVQLASGEFDLLRRIRTALRGLCLVNSGCEGHPEDLAVINDVVRQAAVHPRLECDGQPTLAVDTSSGLGGTGRLVAIVFQALWDGTWVRLKACPGEACHYAFYDRTRNNSRTWCTMARCGSRAKMRAYRARRPRRLDSRNMAPGQGSLTHELCHPGFVEE